MNWILHSVKIADKIFISLGIMNKLLARENPVSSVIYIMVSPGHPELMELC